MVLPADAGDGPDHAFLPRVRHAIADVVGEAVGDDRVAVELAAEVYLDDLRQAAKRVLETEAAGDLVLSR